MSDEPTGAGCGYEPADCYETCAHEPACLMQWERFNGEHREDYAGWLDDLAASLGCSEGCACYEDTYEVPKSMSGVMRP